MTTLVSSLDGRFIAGTNISNTPDTQPSCGQGDGQYQFVPILSGVKSFRIA